MARIMFLTLIAWHIQEDSCSRHRKWVPPMIDLCRLYINCYKKYVLDVVSYELLYIIVDVLDISADCSCHLHELMVQERLHIMQKSKCKLYIYIYTPKTGKYLFYIWKGKQSKGNSNWCDLIVWSLQLCVVVNTLKVLLLLNEPLTV